MNIISLITFFLIGGGLVVLSFLSLKKILFEGRLVFALYFLVYFLAINNTLQIVFFTVTKSVFLAESLTYLKEIYLGLAVLSWFLYRKRLQDHKFYLYRYDYLALAFLLLVTVFYILPVGPASFMDKTIYYKNLLALAGMYFLGRNMSLEQADITRLFHLLLDRKSVV